MRSHTLTITAFLILPISTLQIPSIFAPFYEPQSESQSFDDSLLLSNETLSPNVHELLKRAGSCAPNYNSCSTLAANLGGACCTSGSVCTKDKANHVACCPIGATCTGTIAVGTAASTTPGGGVFGSSTGTGTGATTTATGTTTTTSTGGTATITSVGSVVSNAFFPFPYIATDYPNSAACNTAYEACQSNYAACTADLQGSGFAVTIVAPAGGITVSPTAQNLGSASATSICSSLSSVACYNIQSGNCAQFGAGTGGSFIVGATPKGAAARQTGGCWAGIGMLAGVGLGIAGQMV